MIERNSEDINRLWFDFYMNELESSHERGYKKFDNFFLCPCCYFPTLTERQSFEICFLCDWEDDGQDEHNADKVLGGPNRDYSLTEARENFKKYLTSYRPSDKYHFERTIAKKAIDGKIILDLVEIKRQIIEKYNSAMLSLELDQLKQFFDDIAELEKRLI